MQRLDVPGIIGGGMAIFVPWIPNITAVAQMVGTVAGAALAVWALIDRFRQKRKQRESE